MIYERQRLGTVAITRTSNVDKKSADNERPVLLCNYVDVYKNDLIVSGLSFMPATASTGQIAAFRLMVGDTVITKDSETADDIGIPAYVVDDVDNLVCGYHLAIVRPDPAKSVPRFVYWALRADESAQQWAVLATGVTRVGLRKSDIGKLSIPVPSLSLQTGIADFLDRETAQIDELIAKQNALIELLGERRKAVITQAVTKGLDPSVPMRDSGIEWLGSVPAHWVTTTLKHRFTVLLGKMLDAGRSVRDDDEELPYLRAANIQDHGLALEDVKTMPFTARERSTLRLCAGDLLVVEGGAVGTNYVVPRDMDGWFFQKTVNRVRSVAGDSTILLGHLLRTYRDTGVIDMICNKSTIAHLTSEKLEIIPIAVAPRHEQLQIEAYLDKQAVQIDVLIQNARATVTLFQERRSALITAAVTGKIDVRGAA